MRFHGAPTLRVPVREVRVERANPRDGMKDTKAVPDSAAGTANSSSNAAR